LMKAPPYALAPLLVVTSSCPTMGEAAARMIEMSKTKGRSGSQNNRNFSKYRLAKLRVGCAGDPPGVRERCQPERPQWIWPHRLGRRKNP
jgi:hypothetical protein